MQAVTITQITPTELETLIEKAINKVLGTQKHENRSEADELYTRKQASKFLQICLPNLDEFTRTGQIPASRIGTRVRYSKADLVNSLIKIKGGKAA